MIRFGFVDLDPFSFHWKSSLKKFSIVRATQMYDKVFVTSNIFKVTGQLHYGDWEGHMLLS